MVQGKFLPFGLEGFSRALGSLFFLAGKGQWVFDKLKFELNNAVREFASTLKKSKQPTAVDWLRELVDGIAWFDECVKALSTLLTYLDRVYLLRQKEAQSIRGLATTLFTAHIFQSAEIVVKLKEGIKEWIDWERIHRAPHARRDTITSLIRSLTEYQLFDALFLQPYLSITRSFYFAESARLAQPDALKDDPQAFLSHVAGRIDEERGRVDELLHAHAWSWREVEKVTELELMQGRLEWLSEGIVIALDSANVDALARMYSLFSRVDGLKLLCEAFKAHVHVRVKEIVSDATQDENMVERLLEFRSFLDVAMPLAFFTVVPAPPSTADPAPPSPADVKPSASSSSRRHPGPSGPTSSAGAGPSRTRTTSPPPTQPAPAPAPAPTLTPTPAPAPTLKALDAHFEDAASEAFRAGFKARRNKPAELIAKHIDRAMRTGQREASDEEFARMFEKVLGLYRYTEDKDVFRTFYHRALAKRLLLQRSASDDFEKAVLKKLQIEFDREFEKGEEMFKDLMLSRDKLAKFHLHNSGNVTNISVMVLQRSNWPFAASQTVGVALPPVLQENLNEYVAFYKREHERRVLYFDHSLGTMQLRARLKAGEKELSVSLFQGVVLLLFNEQDEMGFEEIKNETQMEDADLRRTLQSLACGNKKVLKKRPAGRDVNDADVFVFNPDFTDPRAKIHINSIQSKETPEETQKAHEGVDLERKHHLDAAIVRIMKSKKSISHQQLLAATINVLKKHFVPEPRLVKERIEQLIESEYMKRDEELENVYVYVA
ncbi:Cullin-domain-containing protein [Rickenella mellea]|uniref:Cullin-domain-containing protein n=1 Tax=Rickenella mellea TaxID=50990 RepID=A0A4Y7Q3S5_9AGAM|nr:Cullin-domain-containing protein [Rickenella mellea]